MSICKKQKDIKIDSVPHSYFDALQKISKRAIGTKLNILLEDLLVKQGNNGEEEYILDETFKIIKYVPLIEPYRHKPTLFAEAIKALELATKKFSTDGRTITELNIINQVFYQDFHKIREHKC